MVVWCIGASDKCEDPKPLFFFFFSLRKEMEQWQYWYEQYTST